VWAIVRQGRIELLEHAELPEGAKALVTFLPEREVRFWLNSSQSALDKVWANDEDDIYAELLET
jgi:hypothetical protein